MTNNPDIKRCSRCGKEKSLAEFYASRKLKRDRSGYYLCHDSLCKECRKAHNSTVKQTKKKIGVFRDPTDGRLYVHNGKHGCRKLYWTGDMLSILRRYYPCTSDTEVAEMIGVSYRTVCLKAKELGLRKSKQYQTEYRSRTGKLNIRLLATRRKQA